MHTLTMPPGASSLDDLDGRLLTLLSERPHIGVLGASRALGVARGTVQARIDRLVERGVIETFAPQLSPAALGFPVTAFCALEIRQERGHEPVGAHLSGIPEVLSAHTVTGTSDMLLVVVARDNSDLQRVIDRIGRHDNVIRVSTSISLGTPVSYRTLPLVRAAYPESS